MNSRDYQEIDKWRTAATKYKKDLDHCLEVWLKLKNEDRTYQEDMVKLKKELEHYKVELSKQKQPKTSLGEKMVLLHHFGIIRTVNELKMGQTEKYKLLSYILDAHEKAISKAFNTSLNHEDSDLNNIPNNIFLVKIFQEFKMTEAEKEAQQRLDKLRE